MYIISKRIKDLREDNNKTQAEISQYLGIDIKTYCRYEKGHHEIRVNVLVKLAHYYNVSLDYLAGIRDVAEPIKPETKKLSQKETAILKAYKKNKNVQEAVDILLGLK